jgi:hypothetical protein
VTILEATVVGLMFVAVIVAVYGVVYAWLWVVGE